MTLQEVFNLILSRTGEFLIGADNVELDRDKFEVLVKKCLKTYSKYKPKREKLFVIISDYKYTFQDKIPEFISDVNPTYNTVLNPLLMYHPHSNLPEIEWEYRKPTLYTNFNGSAEVEAWFNWEIEVDGSGEKYIELEDELFIDLVTAEFLMGLGRSRRAFTLQAIPISTDSEMLVSEGQKLYEDTIETLRQTSILL